MPSRRAREPGRHRRTKIAGLAPFSHEAVALSILWCRFAPQLPWPGSRSPRSAPLEEVLVLGRVSGRAPALQPLPMWPTCSPPQTLSRRSKLHTTTVTPGHGPPAGMKICSEGSAPEGDIPSCQEQEPVNSLLGVPRRAGRCRAPLWAARRRVCQRSRHPADLRHLIGIPARGVGSHARTARALLRPGHPQEVRCGLLIGDGIGRSCPEGGAHLQHHDRRFARPGRLAAGRGLRTGGHGVDRVLLATGV